LAFHLPILMSSSNDLSAPNKKAITFGRKWSIRSEYKFILSSFLSGVTVICLTMAEFDIASQFDQDLSTPCHNVTQSLGSLLISPQLRTSLSSSKSFL